MANHAQQCLKIHCSITEWLSNASHLKASYPPSRLFQEAKNGAAAAAQPPPRNFSKKVRAAAA